MDLRFRRLFLLRFSLVLWTFYLVYVTGFFAYAIFRPNPELWSRRGLDLQQQTRQATDLLQRGRDADLLESLRHGLRLGRLDFFVWKKGGRILSEGTAPPTEHFPDGQVVEAGDLLLSRLEADGSELEFGVDLGWRARLKLLWQRDRLPWAKDFFLLGLGLALILFVTFRNLAKAAGPIASVAWRPARFQGEPKLLRGGHVSHLELSAGMFGAAAFSRNKPDEIRENFAITDRLLRRYGGSILSVERGVFLFQLPADSAAAFAAARDLSSSGAALSLAAGSSESVHLGSNLSDHPIPVGEVWPRILETLSGSPTFGRVRIAPGAPAPTLPLFRQRDGWQEPAVNVQGAIALARAGDADYIKYFRSDEAILAILQDFADRPWETSAYLAAVAALRTFHCPDGGLEIATACAALLGSELKNPERYRMSVTLALCPHLLNPSAVGPELEALFLRALKADSRTRANAIEVFIHFFPEREFTEIKKCVHDADNRVAANALIKLALEHLDEKVIEILGARIRGGSVAKAASALYALGEIAAHYGRLDPDYLATKEAFIELCQDLPNLSCHPNPMVRRQAIHAAGKLKHRKIDERLRSVFEGCEEEEVRELFAAIYGWRKKGQSAA